MSLFEIPQTINLRAENRVKIYEQVLNAGDRGAHRWRVTVLDGRTPADLAGYTGTLYVIRGDRKTVCDREAVSIEGNTASAIFPPEAYAVEGWTGFQLELARDGALITCAELATTVRRSRTENIILPGKGEILDLQALLAQMDAMRKATKEANEAAQEARQAAEQAAPWSAAPTAVSLPAGSAPTVEVTTAEDGARVLSFGIPRGDTGAQGPVGPKGADGTMTFEDLTDEQRESLRGPQGEQGPQGIQGAAGVGIASIARTAGDGSPGTTDTYTITFTDGQTLQYGVTHGKNGATANQALNTTDTVTFKSVSAETVTANKVIGAVYA